MDVARTSALEFDPVRDVADTHRVVSAEYDLPPEGLDSVLKVAGRQQHILSDHFVFAPWHEILHVLLPWYADSLAIFLPHLHCHLFTALLVHFIDNFATVFFELSCEIGAPPLPC